VRDVPGSLELAYLGDAIYDLRVRERLVRGGGRIGALHKGAVGKVCARAQAEALDRVEPLLTQQERAVVRRARNARQTTPHNVSPAIYHRATALEALVGYLYLTGQCQRMDALIEVALSAGEKESDG
jgi:ribonuclease-3 family protein